MIKKATNNPIKNEMILKLERLNCLSTMIIYRISIKKCHNRYLH